MAAPITITGLEDFALMIKALPCNDAAGHWALGVVHGGTPGTAEIAHTTAYLADASWHATPIPGATSEAQGKDFGVDLAIAGTSLIMIVTEAAPFGPGSSGRGNVYVFPNCLPAAVAAPGAAGTDNLVRQVLRAVRTALGLLG